jgi:hypothetical protein
VKAVIFVALIIGGAYYFYNSNNQNETNVDFENLDSEVKKLAKRVAEKPGKKVETEDLQIISGALDRTDDGDSEAYLVRLLSLGMLAKGDMKSFLLFKKKVERENPDEDYFGFMEEDFSGVCSQCEGEGGAKCKACKGTGSCGNNKCDKGKLTYEGFDGKVETKNCRSCKGTLECRVCAGSGSSINNVCSTCKGSGQKAISSKKAFRIYKDTLKDAE